jgi:protein gp37
VAENSAIEWTDHTFNPWIGCTRVSPGCDNCYAAVSTPARAMRVSWGADHQRHRTADSTWQQPARWNRRHSEFFAKHGRPQRVFCASLADVFDNQVDPAWQSDLFDLIRATPNLDWLLLTKRIGNVRSLMGDAGFGDWPNVWLGVTVVNQEEADRDISKLLATPARVRFLSMEPLLGPVDLTSITVRRAVGNEVFSALYFDGDADDEPDLGTATLDWVIVGGESGPHARPMHPDWARTLRDQCAAAGVPFLFKQWGEFAPTERTMAEVAKSQKKLTGVRFEPHTRFPMAVLDRVGKKAAGRLLDGVTHDGFPEVRHA